MPNNEQLSYVEEKIEKAFQKTLSDIGSYLRQHKLNGKRVFISYAWEDETTEEGRVANARLQAFLLRLSKDLEKIGLTVLLDIEGMKGQMSRWMEDGIAQSDFILLIGTPRYKTCAGMETNVGFEYQQILAKLKQAHQSDNPHILLPLLYSGDFASAFPAEVVACLIRDCPVSEAYYEQVLGLGGILPQMYQELEKGGAYHAEYVSIWEYFLKQARLTEAEAQVPEQNKKARNVSKEGVAPIPAAEPASTPRPDQRELSAQYQALESLYTYLVQKFIQSKPGYERRLQHFSAMLADMLLPIPSTPLQRHLQRAEAYKHYLFFKRDRYYEKVEQLIRNTKPGAVEDVQHFVEYLKQCRDNEKTTAGKIVATNILLGLEVRGIEVNKMPTGKAPIVAAHKPVPALLQ